jgi:holo-[acyl-carrier protein] synthase
VTRGVGIDLVDVDRFTALLERRPTIIERLFTEREVAEANFQPERLAARFAAKEAWLKTLHHGVGAAKWRDIEVVRSTNGAPSFELAESAKRLASAAGVTKFHLSLTHTATSAAAMVVGE